MLSICITVKNRSKVDAEGHTLYLFPNCIQSIITSIPPGIPCEIVVTDWFSDDWPLETWLRKTIYPVPVQIIQQDGHFSRGKGLNEAAKHAKGNYLFFLDADMLVSHEVIANGLRYLDENKAYFPVVFSFDHIDHISGRWIHEGFGNCMVTKGMLHAALGWPEYLAWGKEDNDFYSKIKCLTEVVREEVPGFYHQWHPDDLIWKNRYAAKANEIAQELHQVAMAKNEIIAIIPEGQRFILIDESRFGGSDCIPGRSEFQFPEVNGEYGGPPVDDISAVKELERLILAGAQYIVIAWMAFWWLDYYPAFKDYLFEQCIINLDNERLKILTLKGKSN